MPAKDKKKGKNKETQEEHTPAMSMATMGNVKKNEKQVALVLAMSLQEEEKKKEHEVKSCLIEQHAIDEAVRLSLEEASRNKTAVPVTPKCFNDRPDNYIVVDGVRHLSSTSFIDPGRVPSPFQPWMVTPSGIKLVTLITLGPLNPKAKPFVVEKSLSPKPFFELGSRPSY
jgi:hypothetical protein